MLRHVCACLTIHYRAYSLMHSWDRLSSTLLSIVLPDHSPAIRAVNTRGSQQYTACQPETMCCKKSQTGTFFFSSLRLLHAARSAGEVTNLSQVYAQLPPGYCTPSFYAERNMATVLLGVYKLSGVPPVVKGLIID